MLNKIKALTATILVTLTSSCRLNATNQFSDLLARTMHKTGLRFIAATSICALLLLAHGTPALCATNQELFSEAYERINETQKFSETELRQLAEKAVSKKEWTTAVAAYLVLAKHALNEGNFEHARPSFDQAYALAVHLSSAEKEFLSQKVSLIISDSRDRGDYKYFAQKRLQLMEQQETTDWNKKYYAVRSVALACSQHKKYDEAEKLLKGTLSDLEKITPRPKTYSDCEAALARVLVRQETSRKRPNITIVL